MSSFVAHDGTALVELPALPTYDNLRGEQAQRRFRGPPALILAKFAELKGQGVQSMRITELADGIAFELTGDYPGTVGSNGTIDPTITPVLTDWTLEPVEFAKSIWDFPAVVTELNKLGTDDTALQTRQRIRNYADALVRGDSTVPDTTDPKKTLPLTPKIFLDLVAGVSLDRAVMAAFLSDLLAGVTSFTPNSWNLRRTRRVPFASTFQEEVTNVGRMLRPASLGSEGFSESLLRSRLPSGGYWLKKAPFDRPVGDGNREVTTDYVWTESYSLFLFGSPV